MLQLLKLPDGTVKVLVEGEKRVKILEHDEKNNDFLTCEVEITEDQNMSKELEPLALGLIKKFERLQILNKKEQIEGAGNLKNLKNPIMEKAVKTLILFVVNILSLLLNKLKMITSLLFLI